MLKDVSVPFHRRVALEWNVLRPEFLLHFGIIRSFLLEFKLNSFSKIVMVILLKMYVDKHTKC